MDVAVWVPIKDITQEKSNDSRQPIFYYQGHMIRGSHAKAINLTIENLRSNSFALGSKAAFTRIASMLDQKILEKTHHSEFGEKAHSFYLEQLKS